MTYVKIQIENYINPEDTRKHMEHLPDVPLYSTIPFILMLGAIAVLPLLAHHFWESNKNKLIIALALGIPTAIWMLVMGLSHELVHIIVYDYIPFIILLGALFVITGGIFVDGNLEAKPIVNTIFLAIGAVLASFMGTTGAAMLLIRPVINTNKERKFKVHTILFFIAIVANCGGMLTPLGDPPLYMMYLRGAPFEWFFKLAPEWLFANLIFLIIYYIVDNVYWNKESPGEKIYEKRQAAKISIGGKLNFVWLLGVVLTVAFVNPNTYKNVVFKEAYSAVINEVSGIEKQISRVKASEIPLDALQADLIVAKEKVDNFESEADITCSFLRDIIMLLLALFSLRFTAKKLRLSNNFTWTPIIEVAYLFLGIFITMVPCLIYMESHSRALGISSPTAFYYATGLLSGFLDNTPTAVTFHSLALGLVEPGMSGLVAGIPEELLRAICVSAVYFGAMTYIGNGPNFMVKAISESQNIKMPHFFAYMIKFSIIVLLPVFIIAELLF